MLTPFLLAVAATTATPTQTATISPPPVSVTAGKAVPDPMQAMAGMMKLMDKIFPAGPEPDPARLALARDTTMMMYPKGAYAQGMNGFFDQTIDHVLDMSEADFAGMLPTPKTAEGKGKQGKKAKKATPAKPPSTEPFRVSIAKKEPNFDAKLAAMKAFLHTTLIKVGEVAEPKFREGMARAMARKFDQQQLADIRTFLATPTGAAYGREMVGLWFEPDVVRGAIQLFPEMMRIMPDMMKDVAGLDAQMKSLDKKPQ